MYLSVVVVSVACVALCVVHVDVVAVHLVVGVCTVCPRH